jgi:hypothetical protein
MEQTKPLFRVGGVYGSNAKLGPFLLAAASPYSGHIAPRGFAYALYGDGWEGCLAEFDLASGMSRSQRWHLIPGELHQVNGEWVPVEGDPFDPFDPADDLAAWLTEPTAAPRSDYFQQQLAEEPVKETVSTALPPIAGLSFLPDVAKHSHQVNPGGVVRFGSADLL